MMTGLNFVKLLAAAAVAVVTGAAYLPFPHPGAASSSATAAPVSGPSVDLVYPRRTTLAQRIQINATLEAFEDADLFAQISGYLSEVRVDIGDHVKAGQILAVIDVPETVQELAEAEAQLESKRKALDAAGRQIEHARADLALQQVTFKRQETLNRAKDTSDQSLDNIRARTEIAIADLGLAVANRDLAAAEVDVAAATVEKTRALLSYSKIVAPFDGVVAQRQVNRGDLVQAPTASRTTPLFKIQRIDTIRVFCDVPENEVALVRAGDPATVRPFGLNGAAIAGTITRFAFRLDAGTRNMRTEIDLPNPGERLYPGMYAEVSLEINRRPDVLTVPASAIGTDGDGTFIYTVRDNQIARTPVKIGIRDSGNAELLDGLSEHATLVADAKRAPAAGTRIRAAIVRDKS
jgi:RND family efflux transporter MFP subunit